MLSDEKKRKIYDQVGFYSDNIDAATAEAYARGGGAPGGAGGFGGGGAGGCAAGGGRRVCRLILRGLIFRGFRAAGRLRRAGASEGFGGSFKDVFSGMFGGGGRQARGPQPGTDLEYQVEIDFWTAIRGGRDAAGDSSAGAVSDVQGQGGAGREYGVPGVPWVGTGDADGRADEVQHPVPAVRWYGQGAECLPDVRGCGRGDEEGAAVVQHQGGDAGWAEDSAGG